MATLHLTSTTTAEAGPAVAIVLTDDEVTELGGGKRAAVVVTIGGHSERLRLARMGGANMIGMRREVREAFGLTAGDVVDVTIALDEAPREVEVPPELAAVLAGDGAARDFFDSLAFTHRKEYAAWVGGAKRAETRERRAAQALAMLQDREVRG